MYRKCGRFATSRPCAVHTMHARPVYTRVVPQNSTGNTCTVWLYIHSRNECQQWLQSVRNQQVRSSVKRPLRRWNAANCRVDQQRQDEWTIVSNHNKMSLLPAPACCVINLMTSHNDDRYLINIQHRYSLYNTSYPWYRILLCAFPLFFSYTTIALFRHHNMLIYMSSIVLLYLLFLYLQNRFAFSQGCDSVRFIYTSFLYLLIFSIFFFFGHRGWD